MLVHLPHKEGRGRESGYLEWVYIDVAGPMPVASAGGREYVYIVVVVGDCTRTVCTGPMRLKSEVVEALKALKAFGPTLVSWDL